MKMARTEIKSVIFPIGQPTITNNTCVIHVFYNYTKPNTTLSVIVDWQVAKTVLFILFLVIFREDNKIS